MSQPRRHSLLESLTNTATGFALAMLMQSIAYPWFGIHTDTSTNFYIALLFTVTTTVRSYALRRLFNWLHVRGLLK